MKMNFIYLQTAQAALSEDCFLKEGDIQALFFY